MVRVGNAIYFDSRHLFRVCEKDDTNFDIFLILSNVDQDVTPLKFDVELARNLINCARKFISDESVLNKLDVICLVFFKEQPSNIDNNVPNSNMMMS